MHDIIIMIFLCNYPLTCDGELSSGASVTLVWECEGFISPGFLLRRRLLLLELLGLGRVEARPDVLLLRAMRDSREKIFSGSSSLMMSRSAESCAKSEMAFSEPKMLIFETSEILI